ncbi:MAG: hypothetical protein WC612_03785 [Bdellovibrionales bacterium]|jgi:hypothetical protein
MRRRNYTKKRQEALYRQSRLTFKALFNEAKKEKKETIHILLARQCFEESIGDDSLTVADGYRILRDRVALTYFIEQVRDEYEKNSPTLSLLNNISEVVKVIQNYTNPKLNLKLAATVSALSVVVSSIFSPFPNELLSPLAKKLFGRSEAPTGVSAPHIPAYAPYPAMMIVDNRRYSFYGFSEEKVPQDNQKKETAMSPSTKSAHQCASCHMI